MFNSIQNLKIIEKCWMCHFRNTQTTRLNAKLPNRTKWLTLSYCTILLCNFMKAVIDIRHSKRIWPLRTTTRFFCTTQDFNMYTILGMNRLRTCKERLWTKEFFSFCMSNKNQVKFHFSLWNLLKYFFIKNDLIFLFSSFSSIQFTLNGREDTQTTG